MIDSKNDQFYTKSAAIIKLKTYHLGSKYLCIIDFQDLVVT